MELSREALRNGRVITKRSIYYQDTELFKDQSVVDHLVDDLACTLEIGRNALNIVSTLPSNQRPRLFETSLTWNSDRLLLRRASSQVLSTSPWPTDRSSRTLQTTTIGMPSHLPGPFNRWILPAQDGSWLSRRKYVGLDTFIPGALHTDRSWQATFRTLAVSQYWRGSVHGQGIIVTVSRFQSSHTSPSTN